MCVYVCIYICVCVYLCVCVFSMSDQEFSSWFCFIAVDYKHPCLRIAQLQTRRVECQFSNTIRTLQQGALLKSSPPLSRRWKQDSEDRTPNTGEAEGMLSVRRNLM